MSLEAHLTLRKGLLDLDAELTAREGEVIALLGPNAAGKTTVLRALAGLIPLSGGRVVLDGTVLEDPAQNVHVPTERRRVGVVFQDYLLFPHLTALDNVAFGLRTRGERRAAAREQAARWLESMGLSAHAEDKPSTLSGGQAQRVALARALATDPLLLLLDEPLAAMDAGARADLRHVLNRHLDAFAGTCLLVTHDPIEAMTLADRLVVLEEGRVIQTGTPEEVSSQPRSRHVADLVGLNLFRGRGRGTTIELPGGERIVAADPIPDDGEVFVVIPPRAVSLHRLRPEGSPRNVWPGTAGLLDVAGDRIRVHVMGVMPMVAEVTPAAVAALRLGDGGPVWTSVKAMEVVVYPA